MARRPKAADAEAPEGEGPRKRRVAAPPSNVTDDTIREFVGKAIGAKAELEEAEAAAKSKRGGYRAVLKAAKAAGVDPGHITWFLDARKRDVKDIDRETSWRNRIARVMALPLGTQLGLFEDGTTVATAVDGDKIAANETAPTVDMLITADEQGYQAGQAGKLPDATPYGDPASPLAIRWEKARQKAQEEMVLAMGKGADSGVGAGA